VRGKKAPPLLGADFELEEKTLRKCQGVSGGKSMLR
jgi:hypothetical protein